MGILSNKYLKLDEARRVPVRDDDLVALIKRDCQPWLKQAEGEIAYRKERIEMFAFKGKVRQDRRPLDTDPELHDIVNDMLKEMGYKARRDNSIFVSSSMEDFDIPGPTYVIYPIGNFNFTWNKKYGDFWRDFVSKYEHKGGNFPLWHPRAPQSSRSKEEELFDEIGHTFSNRDLPKALKSKHEIYINCDTYYAIEESIFMHEVVGRLY